MLFDAKGRETFYTSWWKPDERFRKHARRDLASPKSLATLRKWLAVAEEKLGVEFRRDCPLIESNIKGGATAMKICIAEI